MRGLKAPGVGRGPVRAWPDIYASGACGFKQQFLHGPGGREIGGPKAAHKEPCEPGGIERPGHRGLNRAGRGVGGVGIPLSAQQQAGGFLSQHPGKALSAVFSALPQRNPGSHGYLPGDSAAGSGIDSENRHRKS